MHQDPGGRAGWPPSLNGVSMAPDNGNDAVAVGSGGSILTTDTGGSSWSASYLPTRQTLYGVSCPAGTGIDCGVVGAHGTIARAAP